MKIHYIIESIILVKAMILSHQCILWALVYAMSVICLSFLSLFMSYFVMEIGFNKYK